MVFAYKPTAYCSSLCETCSSLCETCSSVTLVRSQQQYSDRQAGCLRPRRPQPPQPTPTRPSSSAGSPADIGAWQVLGEARVEEGEEAQVHPSLLPAQARGRGPRRARQRVLGRERQNKTKQNNTFLSSSPFFFAELKKPHR